MKKQFECSVCKEVKTEAPFLYPSNKAGKGRRFVCAKCHTLKTTKIKTAAKKKNHLPGGKFGV